MLNCLFVLLLIVNNFSCVNRQNKHGSVFNVETKVKVAYPEGCSFSNNKDFYIVECSLYNNTDAKQTFWSLSTCWKDNWITNSDDFIFCKQECNRNFPKKYSLEPHKKMVFDAILINRTPLKDKFKVGFVFVKENEFGSSPYLDFYQMIGNKKNRNTDIFWSNELDLSKSVSGYEIK